MDSDDFRFWGTVAAVLATAYVVVVSALWISCRHTENMARLGYEETAVPGTSSLIWRRAEGNFEMQGSGPRHLGETQKGEKRK